MKKYWELFKYPLIIFIIWRTIIFLVSYLAIHFIPQFGNMYPYANTVLETTGLPSWIWSFGGFDGVHYLRIAQNGYQDAYYQAFFPLYPTLIKLLNIFPKDLSLDKRVFVDKTYFYTGIILSNIFLLVSLLVLKITTGKKNFLWHSLLILSFPTAYYFGATYTESLFLLLLLLFVYFLKNKKYIVAGVIVGIASATRVIGILFLPVLIIQMLDDIIKNKSKITSKILLTLLISPSGLIIYMCYLWRRFNNPLIFISSQPGFGAERSGLPIITFPQVVFRYIKMFISVKNEYQVFTILNEFVLSILVLGLIIWAFKRTDFGIWLLSLLIFLTPTLTGTLSSMPRYVLFSYILLVSSIVTWRPNVKLGLIGLMIIFQLILLALFSRGYWVS